MWSNPIATVTIVGTPKSTAVAQGCTSSELETHPESAAFERHHGGGGPPGVARLTKETTRKRLSSTGTIHEASLIHLEAIMNHQF